MIGCPNGHEAAHDRRTFRFGIETFVDDEGGSTTVAAAVAILASLALVFSLAHVQWVSSRSADVQAVADSGALGCMNMLAAYTTVAQVADALVLSMGLVGMLAMAIGLVVSAIPLVNEMGPPIVRAATSLLEARSTLSKTVAQGLEKLEKVLPYLMAANSLLVIRANSTSDTSYIGVAVPFPAEGSSDFGELTADDVAEKAQSAQENSEQLEELSSKAEAAKEQADEALERGWRADCAEEPYCLRERASTLAGLSGALNPNYPSVDGWDFGVAIERARAYYRQRIDIEAPLDDSAVELARSKARLAFYQYAMEKVYESSFTKNADGTVSCNLLELPRNTEEVKQTTLYNDAVWPCTDEGGKRTIHCDLSCPGATGSPSGTASVSEVGNGVVKCGECDFDVVDLGQAPSASTNIENGFEHHWRDVVRASKDYEEHLAEQVALENEAQEAAQSARDLFSEALERLGTTRVKLDPPGRYGCVCVVADVRTRTSPEQLAAFVGASTELPARVAVAGAVLAPDESASDANVLANFFDGLVAKGGFIGTGGEVLDSLMSTWGSLLSSYQGGYEAFTAGAEQGFATLSQLGFGKVSSWLKDALSSVIDLAALEPADLTPKKPVLTNTENVMVAAGEDWYQKVVSFATVAPALSEAYDASALLAAFGLYAEDVAGQSTLTIAQIPIPGTELAIPLEVDLSWFANQLAA